MNAEQLLSTDKEWALLMNEKDAKAYLINCINNLNGEKRANLRHHANIGTKLFCGEDSLKWAEEGAGCLEALATDSYKPKNDLIKSTWRETFSQLIKSDRGNLYTGALKALTEHSLRQLLLRII